MSTCEIISHQGGGLYSVKINYDDDNRQERLKLLDEGINGTNTIELRASLEAIVAGELEPLLELQADLDDAIAYLISLPRDTEVYIQQNKVVVDTTAKAYTQKGRYLWAVDDLRKFNMSVAVLEVEKKELLRVGSEDTQLEEAWCMDLSDGGSRIGGGARSLYPDGAIVELYCASYDPAVKWLPPAMGSPIGLDANYNVMRNYQKLTAALATFWNAAMEPGFAKWKPLFLTGTITKRIVGPTSISYVERNCSDPVEVEYEGGVSFLVSFDEIQHRFAELTISSKQTECSVSYFAGPEAFLVGDDVIVNASVNQEGYVSGSIIGFVSYPQDKQNNIIEYPTECIPAELEFWKIMAANIGWDNCAFIGENPQNTLVGVTKLSDSAHSPPLPGDNVFVSGYQIWDAFTAEVFNAALFPQTYSGCYIVPLFFYGGGRLDLSESNKYLNDLDFSKILQPNYIDMGGIRIKVRDTWYESRISDLASIIQTSKTIHYELIWICIPTKTYEIREITDTSILKYSLDGVGNQTVEIDERVRIYRNYIVDCNGSRTFVENSDSELITVTSSESPVGINTFYNEYCLAVKDYYVSHQSSYDMQGAFIDAMYGQDVRSTC